MTGQTDRIAENGVRNGVIRVFRKILGNFIIQCDIVYII